MIEYVKKKQEKKVKGGQSSGPAGYQHQSSKENNSEHKSIKVEKLADADRHNGSANAFEGTEQPAHGDE
jgi:hypothetical protein